MKRKLILIAVFFLFKSVCGFPEDTGEDGGYCSPNLLLQISPVTIAEFNVSNPVSQIVLGETKYCSKDLTYTADVDSKCYPTEKIMNGKTYLVFNNSVNDCGIQQTTITEAGETVYEYIATVSKIPDLSSDELSNGIGRYECKSMVFTCNILPDNNEASLKPYKPSPNLIDLGTRNGSSSSASAQFTIKESLDQSTALTDDEEVDVGLDVFVQINYDLGIDSVTTKLQMGECWATPTSNADDSIRVDLIRCDGCAVESEPAGVALLQNNAASPEFTFKSFVWRHIDLYSDDQKIYVHCEVSACIQPNDGSYTCPSFNSAICSSGAVCSKRMRRSIVNAQVSTQGFRVKSKPILRVEIPDKYEENPCDQNNGGCSDKCFVASNGIVECSCFDNRLLQTDSKTCSTQNKIVETNVEPEDKVEEYVVEDMKSLFTSPVILTCASLSSLTFALFLFWDLFY